MNKKLSIAIGALFLAFSVSAAGVKYTLTGKAPVSMEGKNMYLSLFSKRSDALQDSAKVVGGKFVFKGEVASPDMAMIATSKVPKRGDKRALIVLEAGNLTIDLSTDKTSIKGGALNSKLTVYSDSMDVISKHKSESKLNEMMAQYRDSTTTEEQRKETVRLYNAFQKREEAAIQGIINQNLNNVVGAFLFANNKDMYSNEECDAILLKAGEAFKNYPLVQSLAEQLAVVKKRSAGNQYMDFELQDADGKMHKLSEYIGTGKYVLLDFWASWCGPCRAEMPSVKAAYDKYHSKGFDIVSVSLDNKKDAWLKAIEQLGMNWNHLSDLQGWKCTAGQIYGVNGIPCTLLIGPDGVIIGNDYRGEQLTKKLGELLD